MRTLTALFLAICALPLNAAEYGAEFAQHWHDGRAEIAGYRTTVPRYGADRPGNAVAITVTEPFRWSPRVKADRADGDSFGVLKLNLVEDFPTGVYDYNLMTSVFVTTEAVEGMNAGSVVKQTFSSQEWCGQVFQQAVMSPDATAFASFSYFESEADAEQRFPGSPDALTEEALWLWARGLAGPTVPPGGSAETPVMRSAWVVRLLHREPAMDTARLSRAEGTSVVETVLGDVPTRVATAEISRRGGTVTTYRFTVEASMPHRVLAMERSDGYTAELVGVSRLPYWSLNGPDGIARLKDFGFTPRERLAP